MGQPQACVIAVLEAPKAAAGTGAGVLARLAEREEQRAAMAAKRLEELHVGEDPRESVDSFLEEFGARRQRLEAGLQAAAAAPGGGGAQLAALAEDTAELEKALADATYFLPAYDLRQATLALAALRDQHAAAAAALQPRKRFAFNRRPASEASAASAATAAAQALAASQETQQQQQQQDVQQLQPSKQQQDVQQQQPSERQQAQHGSGASNNGGALRGLRGRVVVLGREQAAGREFTLADIEDCTVYLLAPLAGLFLHGLRRCKVYTGPVAGSCLVEGAEDSVLMIAARQVRIHAARSTDLYLRVRSRPIIEHSQRLRFAPYVPAYPGAGQDLEEQGLAEDAGELWRQVDDFGWLRAMPSPHWEVLPEGERAAPPSDAAATHAGG